MKYLLSGILLIVVMAPVSISFVRVPESAPVRIAIKTDWAEADEVCTVTGSTYVPNFRPANVTPVFRPSDYTPCPRTQ